MILACCRACPARQGTEKQKALPTPRCCGDAGRAFHMGFWLKMRVLANGAESREMTKAPPLNRRERRRDDVQWVLGGVFRFHADGSGGMLAALGLSVLFGLKELQLLYQQR